MYLVRKLRIYPNATQREKIETTLKGCQTVSNLFIQKNTENYYLPKNPEEEKKEETPVGEEVEKKETPLTPEETKENKKKFITAFTFNSEITKLKAKDPNYAWLNGCYSQGLTHALMDTEKAFKAFFEKRGGYPVIDRSEWIDRGSYYFYKIGISFDTGNRNVIKLPSLGRIRITEPEYLPPEKSVASGRILRDGRKYWVTFIYDTEPKIIPDPSEHGVAISFSIEDNVYAYFYDGEKMWTSPQFVNHPDYMLLRTKIRTLQTIITKKATINYDRAAAAYLKENGLEEVPYPEKNRLRSIAYNTSSIRSVQEKIQSKAKKMMNIRKTYIDQIIAHLVKEVKPSFIVLKDYVAADVFGDRRGDVKVRDRIHESGFYYFQVHLQQKCQEYQIPLRLVPSEKEDTLIDLSNHTEERMAALYGETNYVLYDPEGDAKKRKDRQDKKKKGIAVPEEEGPKLRSKVHKPTPRGQKKSRTKKTAEVTA